MPNIVVKTQSRWKCKKTERLLNSFQIETELLRQFSPPYLYIRLLTNHDVTHQEECDSATIPNGFMDKIAGKHYQAIRN